MKGIVILTDGQVQPFNGDASDVHNAVGGYIEAVPVDHRVNVSVYCAEEGKLMSYPPNVVATNLWMFLGGSMSVLSGDYLAGNIVVVGGLDRDGDDTDLDPTTEEKLRWVLWLLGDREEE